MPGCHGNGPDHCCWIGGEPCRYLEEGTVEGRRWVCGLYRELGSWGKVHADPRYLADVQPLWDAFPYPGGSCGDYPQNMPAVMIDPAAGKCCYG